MKIGLVIERMDVGRGGRETSTAQLAAALTQAGHEVTIVCQRGQAPPGVAIHTTGTRGLTRQARLAGFAADVAPLAANFDILHAMLPLPGANVYQLRSGTLPGQAAAARRRRGPVLGPIAAGLSPLNRHRALASKFEAQLMADPHTLLLPVSQLVADEIALHYGRRENVSVVYNAVEPAPLSDQQRQEFRQELRTKLSAGDDDTVFLVVAKNYALKGVAETIEAFAQWHDEVAPRRGRLVIVGRDRVQCEGYVRHASLRGIGSACVFVGPESDVARWYAAADVNILLSWYDPCSRVVLEAACLGLPSITTAMNGAAEVLADGAGIVVASPKDRRAVVAAMHSLTDPATRRAASAHCRAIAPRLTMARHVQELQAAYQRLRKP